MRGGESIASIARAVGASEPTVRKRARMEDLSPEPPRRREHESESESTPIPLTLH